MFSVKQAATMRKKSGLRKASWQLMPRSTGASAGAPSCGAKP